MSSPRFVTGSLYRHIVVMTSTAALGLMAIFIVDLVDIYFLSLLGQVELAAAVGYAGSILFFTTAISIGISIAMAALVSRAAGAGSTADARRYVASTSIFALAVTIPLALITWLNVSPLLDLLGAHGRAHQLASLYLRIIIPSMPILALAMCMGGVLRAHGNAKLAMLPTLAGGAVNAVLDPILIFALSMGVSGAAVASVMARITVFMLGLRYVLRSDAMPQRLSLLEFRDDLKTIAHIAVPAMLTNIATPIGNAYVTASIAAFGDGFVAGFSVIGRMIPVAFGIIFAMSGAVGPIIGQNFGAGNLLRVRQTLLDSMIFSTVVVVSISALLFMAQEIIIEIFRAQPQAAALIRFFCTFIALSFVFNGAHFITNATFNNLGRPAWSTLTNWGKATLGTIPFVWFGASWYGAPGALAGQALGSVLFGAITMILAFRLTNRLLDGHSSESAKPTPPLSLRMPLAAHTRYIGWVGVLRRDQSNKKSR